MYSYAVVPNPYGAAEAYYATSPPPALNPGSAFIGDPFAAFPAYSYAAVQPAAPYAMAPALPAEMVADVPSNPILYSATSPAMAALGHPSTWPVFSVPPAAAASPSAGAVRPEGFPAVAAPDAFAPSGQYSTYLAPSPRRSPYEPLTQAEVQSQAAAEEEERQLHAELARRQEAELLWQHEEEVARRRAEAQAAKGAAEKPQPKLDDAERQRLEASCAEADQRVWEQMKQDERASLERQKRQAGQPTLDRRWWSVEQELSQLRQQQAEWELDVMQQEERLREKWEELQVQRSVHGAAPTPFPGLSVTAQSVARPTVDPSVSPARQRPDQSPTTAERANESPTGRGASRDQQLWEEAKRLEQLTVSREHSRAKQQDEQLYTLEQDRQQLRAQQDAWEAEVRRMEEQVEAEREALRHGQSDLARFAAKVAAAEPAEPVREYF
eukprot:EG_transcript_12929